MLGRSARMAGLVVAWVGVLVAAAEAQPVRGPHEVVDSRLTTARPRTPTGAIYVASYHAAGRPSSDPPYMRKMTSYPPPGFRIDTSVPARCTASDVELETFGRSACPAASRIGGGTTNGVWLGRFRSTLRVDIFNAKDQQIFLVGSPGLATVSRGQVTPDGRTTFASPTCFPATEPPGCPVDNALQVATAAKIARYTRSVDGRARSYMTTPRCPRSRTWRTPIRFWWSDGTSDTVVATQRCARRRPR